MKILAVDSSSVTASAAVLDNCKIIAEFFVNAGLTHSQTLAPMINSTLINSGIKISDVDFFAVTTGPGSFTGLRIGLATVKGMALALEKPCVGVSSLLSAAYGLKDSSGIVSVCMDARRKQIYNAVFEIYRGEIRRITEDRAISVEQLGKEIDNLSGNIKLVGDGAEMCYNALADNHRANKIELASESKQYVRASMVGMAALELYNRGEISTAENIGLNYLRVSQAERMLLEGKLRV